LNVSGADAEEGFADFLKELGVLKELNHPGIVRFLGIALSENINDKAVAVDDGASKPDVYLVTEFCAKGSLKDCLDKRNIDVSAPALTRYVHEMACGMEYLNSMDISHNDLACR
jgi:serine/threonine protein kinase